MGLLNEMSIGGGIAFGCSMLSVSIYMTFG